MSYWDKTILFIKKLQWFLMYFQADGTKLPRERALIRGGNLTIRGLKKEDHGRYECVLENEIATLVTSTLLLVESE